MGLALFAGLLGCAPQQQAPTLTPPRPGPVYGSFGVDLTAMDTSIRPADDFYRYVNGQWLENFTIPADRSNYGLFTQLAEQAEQDVRAILEDPITRRQAPKLAALYAAFMDAAKLEALAAAPLQPVLHAIDGIADPTALATAFGEAAREGRAVPVNFYVAPDLDAPDAYKVYFTQSGLGLPDRDYYLKDEPRFVEIRAAYLAYITDLLRMTETPEPEQKAHAILALESRLAADYWPRRDRRDRVKTYNPISAQDLTAQYAGFDWPAYRAATGIAGEGHFVVREPSALAAIVKNFQETSVADWRAYLRFHAIDHFAPYLSQAFVDRHFAFHGTVLSGTPQIMARWRRAIEFVNAAMGEAVGEIYVARHFPPAAKAAMEALVGNVTEAFRQRIHGLDWMTPQTQQQALAKLAKFRTKIGYPAQWRDYGALQVAADDLVGNVRRAASFEHQRQVAKLGTPVDRDEWFMTPQTVNAYYNPSGNEIVFPAAILQPPFFDPDADAAVNYGAIGAVIGHEISHGFDDQGRRSDGDGRLQDWWQPADADAFGVRADALGAQYAGYQPIAGLFLDPKLTMGENIADLAGLSVAYHAYRLSLAEQAAPVIDGFSGDQRFFMGWAQIWRRLYREDELRRRILTAPHSPSEFRTNGVVRNIDAWYRAFDVGPDAALYLPPEQRVRLW
ncbi:MAG: M13 family metallopeptidase [Sphingomonadales bacterium]